MIHHYKIDPTGQEKIVTEDGSVVTGTIVGEPQNADGMGYTSHFATCPQAKNFKRAAR